MISLCWKRVNVLPDADYDELNTYKIFYILDHRSARIPAHIETKARALSFWTEPGLYRSISTP